MAVGWYKDVNARVWEVLSLNNVLIRLVAPYNPLPAFPLAGPPGAAPGRLSFDLCGLDGGAEKVQREAHCLQRTLIKEIWFPWTNLLTSQTTTRKQQNTMVFILFTDRKQPNVDRRVQEVQENLIKQCMQYYDNTSSADQE